MDGEELGATSAQQPGESTPGSGWVTTKQAAKALDVSRRSVQGYVGRGLLQAREEGEGVNKRFLVSIDSLNALLARRKREAKDAVTFAEPSLRTADPFANTGEGLRRLIDRLEARTAEATELRFQLQLTERTRSSLEEELAEARRRREEIERERDELRRELEALRESHEDASESAEGPVTDETLAAGADGHQEVPEAPQGGARPGFFRRLFGG